VQTSLAAIPFELRGMVMEVRGVEHGRCAGCGETYLDLDAAETVQREAVRQLRQARGLMTPDEIRALRATLCVSQAELERLLGTGPKTVVRWEKGTVFQSATADRLMRLLAAKPELVALLRQQQRATTAEPRPRRKAI
jgi:HTH-type transcriptional regulator/antitoxin MqsA